MKIIPFAFAAALFSTPALAADCTLKLVSSLDATTPEGGGIDIPVTMTGSQHVFRVNLATTYSGVLGRFATAQHFVRTDLPGGFVLGTPGQEIAHAAVVPDFQVGSVHGTKLVMLWLPDTAIEDKSVDGWVGTDIWSQFDIELDLKNAKLNLFSKEHCPGQMVYWTSGPYAKVPLTADPTGHITWQMQLDGKPVRVGFGTNTRAYMSMAAARDLFGIDVRSPGMIPLAPESPDDPPSYRYPFKSLTVEGVSIASPAIDIRDDGKPACKGRDKYETGLRYGFCYGGADVWLGLPELRQLHLLFAFSEMTVYATPADAHR